LASSRACSIKSSAIGLGVRFFKVTIAIGGRERGSLMGRHEITGSLAAAIVKVLAMLDVRARFAQLQLETLGTTPV